MAWETAICSCPGGAVPEVAVNASEVLRNNRDLTQYVYVSTIQSQKPNYTYQYKSQTERIQTLMGRLNNPQAQALRSNGGQCNTNS
jgi:hypothetical protein